MIELTIMGYPHIEWRNDDEFVVATGFGDIPIICLMTIPKNAFEYIEEEIENIIEHETIGILINHINSAYHEKYDILFPHTHSLREFLNIRDSLRGKNK